MPYFKYNYPACTVRSSKMYVLYHKIVYHTYFIFDLSKLVKFICNNLAFVEKISISEKRKSVNIKNIIIKKNMHAYKQIGGNRYLNRQLGMCMYIHACTLYMLYISFDPIYLL